MNGIREGIVGLTGRRARDENGSRVGMLRLFEIVTLRPFKEVEGLTYSMLRYVVGGRPEMCLRRAHPGCCRHCCCCEFWSGNRCVGW
jgi:hypothetical protein